MKKMLFGFLATVLLSVGGNAQTNEEIKKVYNEGRPVYAKVMADFVTNLKPSYSKGMTFNTFAKKTSSVNETSKDGQIILQKAFNYLQNGTSAKTIQNEENGYEIATASLNYSKTGKDKPFEDYLFGSSNSTAKGFWGSIWQGIKDAVEWVWDHAEQIISIFIKCCNARICCK